MAPSPYRHYKPCTISSKAWDAPSLSAYSRLFLAEFFEFGMIYIFKAINTKKYVHSSSRMLINVPYWLVNSAQINNKH